MKAIRHLAAVLITFVSLAPAVFAATFVVPPDREMIRRADAIVIATPLASFTQRSDDGGIETVTPVRIEEVLKGQRIPMSITVVEPGGEYRGEAQLIPGVPRFNTSERTLLFLTRIGGSRWVVTEIVLGKFTFHTDGGAALLLRDAGEITGWDPDLTPHRERMRDAAGFLQFIRNESRGVVSKEDYFVGNEPPAQSLGTPSAKSMGTSAIVPLVAPYTATSYTMLISGNQGGRWATFPSAVNWFSGATQEPGAPGGGVTAINAAFTSWDNDCGSNVNYAYAGTDSTHTQGLHAVDGANTILFERDLSSWGVAPFSCSGNSYSGTLGIGGVTSASGTNVVNGETFATNREGDVEMNRGIANCTLLFNNGDWNSAVTHEVGHTLGFRHSDQTRDSAAACTSDASLECSQQAIMKSFISTGLNAALQAWDQHAVQAVYPGNVCAPTGGCTAPAITAQPQSMTIASGGSATLSVGASGTAPLSYQWYVGTSGNTGSPISGATTPSLTVTPSSTTSYWVRVSNACGSANSGTATVTVQSNCTAPTIRAQPGSGTIVGGQGTIAVLAAGSPLAYQWFQGTSGNTAVPISGATSNELTVAPSATTSFWVRVSNACGSVNSATATVSVTGTAPPPTSAGVIKSDFDRNGSADILWRYSAGGQNYVWFMSGPTQIGGQYLPTIADANWHMEGVGDFNHDGSPDILWRYYGTGEIFVWYMNGATQTGGVYLPSEPDVNWVIGGVGDFDGNGSPDIVWRNKATGEDRIWLMNGTTILSVIALPTIADTLWRMQVVGDLNRDGTPDIVWRYFGSGENYVWFMRGTVRTPGQYLPSIADTKWEIGAIADLDNNGSNDLIWRYYGTGQNYVWFMNGPTKIGGQYLPTIGDVNWRMTGPR
ncbi:MAG: hypothetical protein QOI58_2863 [Thermoanaerobaculia bacterium]|jgi:hypothetical protein|nr:hypothetical protein [Thermoanaerobaculia bacterium]